MASISNVEARPILDSRGEWTIEVVLTLKDGRCAVASVPQGKSTGSHEAATVPAEKAVRNIQKVIAPKLKGKNVLRQRDIDNALIRLDGTPNKRRLGANALLGVSIACARAAGFAKGIPFWHHIRDLSGLKVREVRSGVKYPRLYMNVINGGMHGGSNLDIQEYVIIPKTRTFKDAVKIGAAVRRELGVLIERTRGKQATNLGDEGGFAPNFQNNTEPIHLLKAVVKKLDYEKKVDYGADAAATEIKRLKQKQLVAIYTKLIQTYHIVYLEDPFGEEEFLKFADLRRKFGSKVLITGDDLTTTNVSRMEIAHAEGSVNAVIIKPNQIGTLSESLDAVRVARRYGWGVVASHRSGETNDDFIADFSYGVGADGVKLGAPARGERVVKYNRLLEIEKACY